MTPTQRTLKKLKDEGYVTAIVEKWNPHAKIRQDAFGFVDIIALGDKEVLFVQTTTNSHLKEHLTKIQKHVNYKAVKRAKVRIQAHGWGQYVEKCKNGNKKKVWRCTVAEL